MSHPPPTLDLRVARHSPLTVLPITTGKLFAPRYVRFFVPLFFFPLLMLFFFLFITLSPRLSFAASLELPLLSPVRRGYPPSHHALRNGGSELRRYTELWIRFHRTSLESSALHTSMRHATTGRSADQTGLLCGAYGAICKTLKRLTIRLSLHIHMTPSR